MKQKYCMEAKHLAIKSLKWRGIGGTMVGLGITAVIVGVIVAFVAPEKTSFLATGISLGVAGLASAIIGGVVFIRGTYKLLAKAVKAYNLSGPDHYVLPATGTYRVLASEPI
jgi:nitrate reductase gamma subunit